MVSRKFDISKQILETRKETEELREQLQNLKDSGTRFLPVHSRFVDHSDREVKECHGEVKEHNSKPSLYANVPVTSKRLPKAIQTNETSKQSSKKVSASQGRKNQQKVEQVVIQNSEMAKADRKQKLLELHKKTIAILKKNVQRKRSKSQDGPSTSRSNQNINRCRSVSQERNLLGSNQSNSTKGCNKPGRSVQNPNDLFETVEQRNPNLLHPPLPDYMLRLNKTKSKLDKLHQTPRKEPYNPTASSIDRSELDTEKTCINPKNLFKESNSDKLNIVTMEDECTLDLSFESDLERSRKSIVASNSPTYSKVLIRSPDVILEKRKEKVETNTLSTIPVERNEIEFVGTKLSTTPLNSNDFTYLDNVINRPYAEKGDKITNESQTNPSKASSEHYMNYHMTRGDVDRISKTESNLPPDIQNVNIHRESDWNRILEESIHQSHNSRNNKSCNKKFQDRDTQTSLRTNSVSMKIAEEIHFSKANLSSINCSKGPGIDVNSDSINFDNILSQLEQSTSLVSTGLELSSLNKSISSSVNSKTDINSNFENHNWNNPVGMSLLMYEQLIKDEDVRLKNLKTILKIRENALLDRTKAGLMCLELQREHLRETGKLQKISVIKAKQRGLLINHQMEVHEIQRMKQMQEAASLKRKIVLKKHRNVIKHQLCTDDMLSKMKVTTPREYRLSGPLKVVQSRESLRSETSISRRSSNGDVYSITSHTHSIVGKVSEVSGNEAQTRHAQSEEDAPNLAGRYTREAYTAPISEIKRMLLMREATLQERRKAAEDLLQWNKKLLMEEKRITELELTASAVICRNSNLASCKMKFTKDNICKPARKNSNTKKTLLETSPHPGDVSNKSLKKDVEVPHKQTSCLNDIIPTTTVDNRTIDDSYVDQDIEIIDQALNKLIENFSRIQEEILRQVVNTIQGISEENLASSEGRKSPDKTQEIPEQINECKISINAPAQQSATVVVNEDDWGKNEERLSQAEDKIKISTNAPGQESLIVETNEDDWRKNEVLPGLRQAEHKTIINSSKNPSASKNSSEIIINRSHIENKTEAIPLKLNPIGDASNEMNECKTVTRKIVILQDYVLKSAVPHEIYRTEQNQDCGIRTDVFTSNNNDFELLNKSVKSTEDICLEDFKETDEENVCKEEEPKSSATEIIELTDNEETLTEIIEIKDNEETFTEITDIEDNGETIIEIIEIKDDEQTGIDDINNNTQEVIEIFDESIASAKDLYRRPITARMLLEDVENVSLPTIESGKGEVSNISVENVSGEKEQTQDLLQKTTTEVLPASAPPSRKEVNGFEETELDSLHLLRSRFQSRVIAEDTSIPLIASSSSDCKEKSFKHWSQIMTDRKTVLADYRQTSYKLVSPTSCPRLESPKCTEYILKKPIAVEQDVHTDNVTIIPTVDEIEEIAKYSAKIFYEVYLSHNLDNIFISDTILGLIFKNITKECYQFVFDLCMVISQEYYKQFKKEACPSWLQIAIKPQLAEPLDVGGLQKYLIKYLNELFEYTKTSKERAIIRWSGKYRDHIDDALVKECQVQDARWTNYDKDELIVMDDIVNGIMNNLLSETAQMFTQILSKRIYLY